MRRATLLLSAISLVIARPWSPTAIAGTPASQFETPARPHLLVMLVVDQMRNDYIEDYGAHWTGGLRRLLRDGARFTRGEYPYLNTVTCAGHATISTGASPRSHGIILNEWWHREEQKILSCTDDPAAPIIGYGTTQPAGGHSARRLLVPAFAQVLRQSQEGRGRVVTLSVKARSAIMLAGGRADAVTWFEGRSFATSKAFGDARVPFVERFVASAPVERDFGKVWERMLPTSAYKYADDAEGEKPPAGWTRTFPHQIATPELTAAAPYTQWTTSPYADEYLGRMAAAAVDALDLGREPGIDYLGVSFSALDIVGHKFGPRSHEVQDLLARLDLTIGRLLAHLDERVGRGKYVVAFTADHGVAVIPEQLQREGQDAGRAIMDAASARAESAAAEILGRGKYVARMNYTNLYFLPGVFDRLVAKSGQLEAVMRSIAQVPGVSRVIDRRTLDTRAPAADDAVARYAALSDYPVRSGDLIVVPRSNWIWVADDKTPRPGDATTHGTWYPYDTRVPVVLFGAGVKPGRYDGAATPADIAPTLARMAGVALPTATGRVLEEALVE